jgi:hypothetical protein
MLYDGLSYSKTSFVYLVEDPSHAQRDCMPSIDVAPFFHQPFSHYVNWEQRSSLQDGSFDCYRKNRVRSNRKNYPLRPCGGSELNYN